MTLRHRQKLWQRILLSWPTLFFLFLLTIFLSRGLWNLYSKSEDSIKRAEDVKKELSKLLKRKNALEQNLNRVRSTTGIEAELRSKFDVAKEGEHLLVITDKEIETKTKEEIEESWWNILWKKWNN